MRHVEAKGFCRLKVDRQFVLGLNGLYLFVARPGAPALRVFRLLSVWFDAKERELLQRAGMKLSRRNK
jgi:hypothetical protein